MLYSSVTQNKLSWVDSSVSGVWCLVASWEKDFHLEKNKAPPPLV